MSVHLAENNYGKSRVRLVKVTRHSDRHDLKELTVNIQLRGDFETAHTVGDNSKILPTDTMKNTVYALAAKHPVEVEAFGLTLAGHFLAKNPQVSEARIELREHLWTRMVVNGRPHRHSFLSAGNERRVAWITQNRENTTVEAGVDDLLVLKTTGSGFVGFIKDHFTTLPEVTNRIFSTVISARWKYTDVTAPFGLCWHGVRQIILDTFAEHDSKSVQQTLYAIGQAILETYECIAEIHISLPNKHCLPVNLVPFGMENKNEIFVPTDEPHGLIEARITR